MFLPMLAAGQDFNYEFVTGPDMAVRMGDGMEPLKGAYTIKKEDDRLVIRAALTFYVRNSFRASFQGVTADNEWLVYLDEGAGFRIEVAPMQKVVALIGPDGRLSAIFGATQYEGASTAGTYR